MHTLKRERAPHSTDQKISFETDISNELSLSSYEIFVGNHITWHRQEKSYQIYTCMPGDHPDIVYMFQVYYYL